VTVRPDRPELASCPGYKYRSVIYHAPSLLASGNRLIVINSHTRRTRFAFPPAHSAVGLQRVQLNVECYRDCSCITGKPEVVQLERIFTTQSRSNLIGHRGQNWLGLEQNIVRAEGLEPSWAD
jgi:hypothetical protein